MITTKIHGIIDYIVGIALILAPYIFQFSTVGGAAVAVPTILGIALILYSVFTEYELGIIRLIPMKVHLAFDFIAAAFLALSPWLFGFSSLSFNVWMPHVVVGIVVILVVLLSSSVSTVAHVHRTQSM